MVARSDIWLFAIPACEIPQTGNVVAMQVGEYAIVIVRGADGVIRAFRDACRHRGSRVRTAQKGSAPKLVCPYRRDGAAFPSRICPSTDPRAPACPGATTFTRFDTSRLRGERSKLACLPDFGIIEKFQHPSLLT
jgi:nitrite reductase/ring-hydroxylating ferredoxin subunit